MCNPSKEGDYGNRGQLPSPNKIEINHEGENGQERATVNDRTEN